MPDFGFAEALPFNFELAITLLAGRDAFGL
jgi:hypothetical protein